MSPARSESKPLIMTPHEALKRYFGFSGFLEGQEEVVSQIVSGADGLVVMPTGGGNSLCYQLPGLCFHGVTLVVSPLIALMKDQVDALIARGTGAYPILGTSLIPLAGATGGPPGGRNDGHDFVLMLKRSEL